MKHLLPLIFSPALMAGTSFDRVVTEADAFDPLTSPFAYAGVTFGSADVDAPGDLEVDYYQGRFYTPLTPAGIDLGPQTKLYFELDYTYTNLDIPTVGDIDLHKISVPITLFHDFANSPWSFFATAAPEIATDFESINGDDFGINGAIAARYEFSENLSAFAGIAYTRSLGDPGVYPLLGLDWRISDNTALQISGSTATLSHRISDSLIVRAGTYATGGYWNIEESGLEADLGFVTHNVGIGIDYALTENVWLSIWGGTTIGNEIALEEPGGGSRTEQDLDSGYFGYVGIRIYEW